MRLVWMGSGRDVPVRIQSNANPYHATGFAFDSLMSLTNLTGNTATLAAPLGHTDGDVTVYWCERARSQNQAQASA